MSHELDFSLGQAAIAIRHDGQTPWHGYGARILPEQLDDLDAWRVAGGLNWAVREQKIFYAKGDPAEGKGRPTQIPNRKALVRDDTEEVLSVVSDRYHVVQPEEIVGFYKDLIEDQGFVIDTVGALSDGKRIWALAKAGDGFSIMGQDRIENYVLAATSYDASTATIIRPTGVRVVCHNTLTYALSTSASPYVAVPHSTKPDWEAIKSQLGLIPGAQHQFEDEVNQLAEFQVDLESSLAFFKVILGKEAVTVADDGKVEYSNNFKKLFALYEIGTGQELRSANHTAWGLVNAVTEYQDHVVKARNNGTRMNSAWFGQGAVRKARAFEQAKELAGVKVAA